MSGAAPRCIVLGGINGAGKTTSSRTILADTLRVLTFVNADVIAQGLSGFDPDSVNLAAGRIMLDRLHELAAERADFAFETTLAGTNDGRMAANTARGGILRSISITSGWRARILPSERRVALQRVKRGGHNIPEATIRRRYQQSIQNFFQSLSPRVEPMAGVR